MEFSRRSSRCSRYSVWKNGQETKNGQISERPRFRRVQENSGADTFLYTAGKVQKLDKKRETPFQGSSSIFSRSSSRFRNGFLRMAWDTLRDMLIRNTLTKLLPACLSHLQVIYALRDETYVRGQACYHADAISERAEGEAMLSDHFTSV